MSPPAEAFRTARLVLTPLTVDDATAMAQVLADPRLYEFTGGEPATADELRRRYELQVAGHSLDGTQEWLNWVVRLGQGDEPVGTVQATVVDGGSSAEIAWVVGVRWQGRGYAREAATGLVAWLRGHGVGQVVAHIHPEHRASEAVARAAGLELTGKVHDGERRWELAG